jgi:hypothetical protein
MELELELGTSTCNANIYLLVGTVQSGGGEFNWE